MALRLYNTMGRKYEEFKPLVPGKCGFYGCGPTVYNYAHLGNLRAYVCWDLLDRTLSYLGYDITHVMNITDVGHLSGDSDEGDDKMVKTAEEKHQSVLEIAQFYTDAFFKDFERLNIRTPDVVCKATEHVDDMIELIKKLEANGHTYMAGGNLYYDISTFKNYGELACLNLDDLVAGAGRRKEVVIDENKKNPQDFALWFTKSKFENQALTWDSPWGRGYPGWHIECSAMSMKYLGKHFDIHMGGIDHVPVHHTNEIAQSEGSFTAEERAEGRWVNYWLHNEFLVIDGATKMSKSSGNFLTVQVLVDKGYDALDYRYFLLGGHYRSQLAFSWASMDTAKNSRKALVQRVARILKDGSITELPSAEAAAKKTDWSEKAADHLAKFTAALEDDLNSPKAISELQVAVKDNDIDAAEKALLIARMDSVIGLRLLEKAAELNKAETEQAAAATAGTGDSEIDALIAERNEAKKNKNWARADEIRNMLKEQGITIIDTPQGTRWEKA